MAVLPAELARTLVDRQRRLQRAEQSRAEAIRSRLSKLAQSMKREGLVDRVWLIGSLAWGGFGWRSDVDIVVSNCSQANWSRLWNELTAELGIEVDLLRIEELPPEFAERVRLEGAELA